jgi:putative DNA primase/helicase
MSSLDNLTSLQRRAREAAIGRKLPVDDLRALGIEKWEAATDEQCYAVIGDAEIVVGQQPAQQGTASERGSIPKAQHACTDLANANRLARTFGKKLISVGGVFHAWDGTRWKRDTEGEAYRCAAYQSQIISKEAQEARKKAVAAHVKWQGAITPAHEKLAEEYPRKESLQKLPEYEEYEELDKAASALESWGKESEMKHRQDAALALLQRTLTVDPSTLNRDPWLLNCQNGTVDLRTGTLKPHDPADYITHCAPARFNSDAKAPMWERFIAEIVEGGEDTARFLQRWFGYCCTGDVREHHIIVHWGKGRNGKGTEIRAVEDVLGDGYTGVAPPHLLAASERSNERHPTEIMELFGRRLVTAHEPDEGAVFREGSLKQMTGGDKLKGRYMHKDFVEFDPTHKLQLLTNHKPSVKGQDDGIWSRLLLVRYPNKYGSAAAVKASAATHLMDLTLQEKLLQEREGILNWMVEGARAWLREGLNPPEAVLKASREYQSEQDRIGLFIKDRCACEPAAQTRITGGAESLFKAYTGWCAENNFHPLGSTKFKEELLLRPGIFEHRWDEGKGASRRPMRGVRGIRLVGEEFPDELDHSTPAVTVELPASKTLPPAEPVAIAAIWEDGPVAEPVPKPNGNGTEDPRTLFRKGFGPKMADALAREGFSTLEQIEGASSAALDRVKPGSTEKDIVEFKRRAREARAQD